MDDLEINSQYAVTVGRKDKSANFIVRRYDRNNITSTIENTYVTKEKNLDKFHAQSIDNDYLAVVTTSTNTQLSKTLCFVVDVPASPNMNILQSQYIDGYREQNIIIRDIDYDSADQHILFVENTPSASVPIATYAIVDWDVSFPNPVNVNIYYPTYPNYLLNGITNLEPATHRFAAVGVDQSNNEYVIWYGERNGFLNTCNNPVLEQTISYPAIISKHVPVKIRYQTSINQVSPQVSFSIIQKPTVCD
ncbi:MAG: hypothetical protein LBR28_03160 [Bacteroidales bacterium]|jgi:hypothetical protein|nr:hypothetical protein [Bacteroidales bacterium]